MIDVTCAVIRNEENEILIVQRGENSDHPYKWEFPGGKIMPGESDEECIIREIKEELAIDIVIFSRLKNVIHDYGIKKINLIPFICDTLDERPVLAEHVAFKWVNTSELLTFDYSEADIFVAKNYISLGHYTTSVPQPVDQQIPQAETEDDDFREVIRRMMSNKEAEWVATSAIENPSIFRKLYEYSFSSEQHLAFRASWTLTKVCDRYPESMKPYLPEVITKITNLQDEGTLRSFLQILSRSDMKDFNGNHHGILMDFCFELLRSGTSAIAIKAYSMEILYKLTSIYPEMTNEFSSTLRIVMEDASAGIKARGNMILKKL